MDAFELIHIPLLFVAGMIAGGMNAVAGGGTFITFPTMVFAGVPPLIANASNTVAISPASFASAWAYRHDFQNFDGVPFKIMLGMSLVGSIIGATLLMMTPERTFNQVIPWLLLLATMVFTFGPKLAPRLQKIVRIGPVTLTCAQFIIAIYGGYFGGAIGIMMLAVWSLFGLTNINAMNASKTILGGVINGIAVFVFVFYGMVWWPQTLVTMAGALVGGYYGANTARRMNPKHVRAIIISISVFMTVVFFVRA